MLELGGSWVPSPLASFQGSWQSLVYPLRPREGVEASAPPGLLLRPQGDAKARAENSHEGREAGAPQQGLHGDGAACGAAVSQHQAADLSLAAARRQPAVPHLLPRQGWGLARVTLAPWPHHTLRMD